MDWRSMFVYDSTARTVRLIGAASQRAEYARVMFARRARYRHWLAAAVYQRRELGDAINI